MKPHPTTKELPITPEDTVAARPLASHSAIHRLIAGFIAKLITVQLRPLYLELTQWGLVPSGLEAASRRHQIYVDLATDTLVHAAMDIKNAHTSIAHRAKQSSSYSPTEHTYLLHTHSIAFYSSTFSLTTKTQP